MSIISETSPAINGSGYETKPNFILENNDVPKFNTVPCKLDPKQHQDELDDLIKVEREWKDHEKPYQTLPSNIVLSSNQVFAVICENRKRQTVLILLQLFSLQDDLISNEVSDSKISLVEENGALPSKSSALRRRPGRRFDKTKLRRRCSINGHYYNRETSVFTPPYGMLDFRLSLFN